MRQLLPFIAACLLLGLASCDSGNNENQVPILPVHANVTAPAPTENPGVFLQKSALDINSTDDIVILDVMLQSTASVTFYALALDVLFDPGLVNISRIDWAATPLGDCTSTMGACNPICESNVSPASGTPANGSGDLVLGLATNSCFAGATTSGPTKLLTLWFNATTVGTSDISLSDQARPGNCGILDAARLSIVPAIPCDPGHATVTAAR